MEHLNFSGKNVNRACKGQSKIITENDKIFTNK